MYYRGLLHLFAIFRGIAGQGVSVSGSPSQGQSDPFWCCKYDDKNIVGLPSPTLTIIVSGSHYLFVTTSGM